MGEFFAVTAFSYGEENFVSRIVLPKENFARQSLARLGSLYCFLFIFSKLIFSCLDSYNYVQIRNCLLNSVVMYPLKNRCCERLKTEVKIKKFLAFQLKFFWPPGFLQATTFFAWPELLWYHPFKRLRLGSKQTRWGVSMTKSTSPLVTFLKLFPFPDLIWNPHHVCRFS